MSDKSSKAIRVLIVDDIHPVFTSSLEENNFEVSYCPDITYSEAIDQIKYFEVLIVRSKFKVRKDFLDKAVQLKLIGRAGAGVDNIDVDYATFKGIKLVNAPEGNCDAVAEHMLGMLLSLMNRICIGDSEIRNQVWEREGNRGVELGGRTVGLIGYGNNGKAMAKKLSGFGVKVLAYDKYLKAFSDSYVTESPLSELFMHADVVSLHVPLTEETRFFIDSSFFRRFSKPIFLLNGSRGEIVQLNDLVKAMESGWVIGAGLDVLPIEKFPDLNSLDWYQSLSNMDNVLFTPHVAGWSKESYYKISKVLANKVLDFYSADLG